jgi:peptide/nickel transport system substrate-binding protein
MKAIDKTMSNKLSVLGLAMVFVSLALIFSVTPIVSSEPQSGGTLNVAISSWPQSLDPHISGLVHDRHVLYQIFDTLVAIDENFELQPELATSWYSPDSTTIVLELRKDVKFHDGTSFDAEAVKFNFERMKEHPRSVRGTEIDAIESVTVVDPYTVALNLKYSAPGLLNTLADRSGMMVSPSAVQEMGDGFAQHPVGTGPFKFEEMGIDHHIQVTRFEDYWEPGLPYLDSVVFYSIMEEPSKVIGLRTGEFHLIDGVPPRDIATLKRNPDVKYYEIAGTGTNMLLMNVNKAPLDNKMVRQAICYAIDREAMIEGLLLGQALPARGPFAPSRGYTYHPDIERYTYDPDKARELLVEAGYPDGFEITLDVINRTADRQWAETIQAFLADIGIKAQVLPVEQVSLNNKLRDTPDEMDTWVFSWGSGRINPDEDLIRAFASYGTWNFAGLDIPGMDELIDEILLTYDIEERGRLYREAQDIIMEYAPMAFLFHQNIRTATTSDVQGYVPMPDWGIRVKDVWLDD